MEVLALVLIIGVIVFVQTLIYAKNALKNLTYDCRFNCSEACEGDEIQLIETLTNRKWLPIPWLKAELNTSRWLDFAGSQSVVTDRARFVPSFFMIGSYQKIERAWKVKCLQSGAFAVEAIVVATDLFGRVTLSEAASCTATITVLPRPFDFEMATLSAKQMLGDIIVKRHLIPDPFMIAGVREYTERDPVSKIHWAATAKVGRIMVYNNDYTAKQSLCVILNMQSRAFEKFEVIEEDRIRDGIRVCARLFDDALIQGMSVCFVSNAATAVADAKKAEHTQKVRETIFTHCYWGNEHVHDLLRILANLALHSTQDFGVFMADIYNNITATDVFIVTAFLDDAMVSFARSKGYDGVNVTFLLMGSAPEVLPDDIMVFLLGGERI